ncbi:MAG: hypothetical protein ACOYNC_03005 [Bacteroidales bacterium]
MIYQLIIVNLIILSAMVLMTIRIVQFFRTPPSKCHGCSGCKLEELKNTPRLKPGK